MVKSIVTPELKRTAWLILGLNLRLLSSTKKPRRFKEQLAQKVTT